MPAGRPLDIPSELLDAFGHSGRVSEYLVSVLSDDVWRVDAPSGRGRSIAAIVAHMQSVRRTFARMAGARSTGASLDRRLVTRAQARSQYEPRHLGSPTRSVPHLPRGGRE